MKKQTEQELNLRILELLIEMREYLK